MSYIQSQDKDKLLVLVDRDQHMRFWVYAREMYSLTVPLSSDARERRVHVAVVDGYIRLLRDRLGAEHRRSGRRVLLRSFADGQELAAAAELYLQHDLVFIPVTKETHCYVLVLNFDKGEFQVLDGYGGAGITSRQVDLAQLRLNLGSCMAAAGRCDVAGWELRVVEGLPVQADRSSCGLFVLKFMELWDGEELMESFGMDDVHDFRTKLAEELIFSEFNMAKHVKDEIEVDALLQMLQLYD